MITDESLVQLAQQGDSSSFDEILERYKGSVRIKSKLYFILGNDETDVASAGMAGLCKAINSFDGNKRAFFKTYAERSITNEIIKFLSKTENVREEKEDIETYLFRDLEDEIFGRENRLFSDFEKKVLKKMIKGQGYVSIAEDMTKTPKQIDNAIQRIKRKLQNYLYS